MVELKDMDIILFEPKNRFGKLIAWLTNSPFSHSEVVFDAENRLLVGARKDVTFHQLKGNRKYSVFRLKQPLSTEQIKKGKAYLSKMAGVEYDLPNLLDIFINLFRTALGRSYRKYWGKSELPVCSELVANCFLEMGISLVDNKPSWAVTPADIAKSPLLEEVK